MTTTIGGEGRLHYTIDGSEPTCVSAPYSGPHDFEEPQVDGRREVVLRAIACNEGYANSLIATVNYVIEGPLSSEEIAE